MADLPGGKTPIVYSGAAQTYTVTADGNLTFKLWGGAGGGSNTLNIPPRVGYGGAGGWVKGTLSVSTGDVIKVEVGGGGRTDPLSGNTVSPGGWPDGGKGGYAYTIRAAGGGGGSTRLYLNDVLMAVAGGGGGANHNETGTTVALGFGGAGGGLVGADGFGEVNARGFGGTQTAGGTAALGGVGQEYKYGSSLKGGDGFIVNADTRNGGGGGGGYFGGGAGAYQWSPSMSAGAGGGSSYLHPTVTEPENIGGVGKVPPMTTDADYVAGVAVGADNGAQNVMALPGGPGFAVLEVAAQTFPTIPAGKSILDYSGAEQKFVMDRATTLDVRLWGGAGAPANRSDGSSGIGGFSGGGGFVTGRIPVETGDVVEISVAQGGRGGVGGATPSGGLGGWPNGGNGARYYTIAQLGGGGGATILKVNGVIMLVAGGGGGSGLAYANGGYGGPGGGLSGQNGYAANSATLDFSENTYRGIGGSQTAAGVSPYNPAYNGVGPRGGHGYNTTAGDTITSIVTNPGAGGGGGYYGGSASASTGSFAPGGGAGGGSSYYHPSVLVPRTATGAITTGAPGEASDADRGGKAAGRTATTGATGQPGGDGRAVILTIEPPEPLGHGKFTESYVGFTKSYAITQKSELLFKLWGGGGSGAAIFVARPLSYGGPGGYVAGTIAFEVGDVLTVEVASGGSNPAAIGKAPGVGGWPDGGPSGFQQDLRNAGAGGGSTRIYRNGTLMAVAAGGGGGNVHENSTGSLGYGGAGGGLTGADGNPAGGWRGTGGSQTTGGVNMQRGGDLDSAGGYLRGGSGGNLANPVNVSNSTGFVGSGGGGGYYGGGGSSGLGTGISSGAGGGSSYLHPSVEDGVTAMGAAQNPPMALDPDYLTGIAAGSNQGGPSAQALPGGNGLAVLNLIPPQPKPVTVDVTEIGTILITSTTGGAAGATAGNATGSLPVVTVVTPVGAFSMGAQGSGDFGSPVLLTAPQTTAQGGVGANLPTIYVTGDLGGQPQTDALVVTGVGDDILYPTPPQMSLTAGANYKVETLPVIGVQPMNYILGNGFEMYVPLEIVVQSIDGDMSVADMWVGEIDSVITLTQPDATAAGNAAWPPLPITVLAQLYVMPPQGDMRGPDEEATGDLGPSIQIDPLLGLGELPVTYTTMPFENDIDVGFPVAAGSGEALVDVGPSLIASIYVSMLDDVLVEVPAAVSRDLGLILVGTPQAAFTLNAAVRVNYFDRIYLTPPSGFAAELTAAIVNGDLSDSVILVSPPEAGGAGGYSATAVLPALYVQPTEAYVEDGDGIDVKGGAGVVIRYKRALMQGNVPVALEPLEIALNEYDGLLFAADDAGVVQSHPVGRFALGGVAPEGGAPGQVLYADGTWRAPSPVYQQPVMLPMPAGDRYLTDFSMDASTHQPPVGRVVYRPFFLPRPTTFTRFGVTTVAASSGTIRFGVCRWNHAAQAPGEALTAHQVSASGAVGPKVVDQALTLAPGWYAAMVAVTGAIPTLATRRAPSGRAADLTLVGDLSAPDTGNLVDTPAPTAREAAAEAYVWATT